MALLGGRAGAGCMGVPQVSLLRAWPVNMARSLSMMGNSWHPPRTCPSGSASSLGPPGLDLEKSCPVNRDFYDDGENVLHQHRPAHQLPPATCGFCALQSWLLRPGKQMFHFV